MIQLNRFSWGGALNVPQYGTFEYKVPSPPKDAKWITPEHGTIKQGAGTSDVQIQWGAGPVVGKAIYQASSDYIWDLGVNVVQIKVEAPDQGQAFTAHNAVDGPVNNNNQDPRVQLLGPIKEIYSGPANGNALDWQATVTIVGALDGTRGVNQMKVGFAQEAEIAQLNATYNGIAQLRVHVAQGHTYTDGDQDHSTMPWYLTTMAATFFTPAPGGAGGTSKTIVAFDNPSMYFPVLANKQLPAQNHLTTIDLDWRFHLSVIAQTVDTRNDADSQYIKQAKAEWSWATAQVLGANYTWQPVNITAPTAWQADTTGENALNVAPWGNQVIRNPAEWGS